MVREAAKQESSRNTGNARTPKLYESTVKPRYNDEVFHKIYIVIGRISLYQRRAYI